MAHEYRFGIEEELFLADSRTRSAPRGSVSDFHGAARSRLDGVEREMLESQAEICSKPSASFTETHEALARLRTGLCALGREHGLKVFAAGTHPTAIWTDQRETAKARYRRMIETLQMVGRRSIVSGLHVHVEVPDPDQRIALINRLMPFLPVLLALSTSSPFYERHRTGLAGYRLRAYAELPRTGLPELFADGADFARYVRVMTRAGAIEDATFLWWHIRPSVRYPTLELRVADSCTRLKDTLAVAALYRCLVRLCVRRPELNAGPTGASRGFVMENLWRVQREGIHAALIDETEEEAVPVRRLVERLLDLVAEDAAALGCAAPVAHALTIVECGSSADGQIRAYEAALATGGSERKALSCVIDWLARETADCAA